VLRVKGLSVVVDGVEVLHDVGLELNRGELVAVMGPNGSGKTTLARAIMGDPRVKVRGGIGFKGKELKGPPEERSRAGIFLCFQNPPGIEGINTGYFLETLGALDGVEELAKKLGVKKLLSKDLNVGFSGGEKKKMEILQLFLKDPELVILDEIDSGLDIDSLHIVGELIKSLKSSGKAVLVITHYTRVFKEVKPDRVYVLVGGKIVGSGGPELLSKLDGYGFKEWK